MNKLLTCYLLLMLSTTSYGSSEKSGDMEPYILQDHPFYSLFDSTGWDHEVNGPAYFNRDGSVWVKEDSGRILFGVWHRNRVGNICVTLAGEIRGCYLVTGDDDKIILADQQNDSVWVLEVRPGRSDGPLLNAKQQKLLDVALVAVGVTDPMGTGAERLYLHRDGAYHVVQADGWIKTGAMWFRDSGGHCDNVNGRVDCIRIISVDDKKAVKEWVGENISVKYDIYFHYDR